MLKTLFYQITCKKVADFLSTSLPNPPNRILVVPPRGAKTDPPVMFGRYPPPDVGLQSDVCWVQCVKFPSWYNDATHGYQVGSTISVPSKIPTWIRSTTPLCVLSKIIIKLRQETCFHCCNFTLISLASQTPHSQQSGYLDWRNNKLLKLSHLFTVLKGYWSTIKAPPMFTSTAVFQVLQNVTRTRTTTFKLTERDARVEKYELGKQEKVKNSFLVFLFAWAGLWLRWFKTECHLPNLS